MSIGYTKHEGRTDCPAIIFGEGDILVGTASFVDEKHINILTMSRIENPQPIGTHTDPRSEAIGKEELFLSLVFEKVESVDVMMEVLGVIKKSMKENKNETALDKNVQHQQHSEGGDGESPETNLGNSDRDLRDDVRETGGDQEPDNQQVGGDERKDKQADFQADNL